MLDINGGARGGVQPLAIISRAIYFTIITQAPSPALAGPLDDLLCFSVYTAGLAFNRVYTPILDRLGLTYPQYLALTALGQKENQSVGELGQSLHLDSNTITPLLKRLEAAGLVVRTRDPRDERVVRVALSERGRALAEDARRCVPDQLREATGLGPDELAALTERLNTLAGHLRETGQNPASGRPSRS